MGEQRGPLKIDLHRILRERVPRRISRWIPTPAIRGLERLVRQKELNGILERAYPAEGSAFADAALRDLDIKLELHGLENIPDTGRFIFASNHPLGGLDGIALIKVLGERYGDENVRFLVNDMLMNVAPLRTVFLPINKYGTQAREATQIINETYRSDRQLLIFPAGLVSRRQGEKIEDLKWQKTFVSKAIRYERDIIPVKFEGLNTPRFYNIAHWRKKLGLKFNLEQTLLPSEVVKSQGKTFRITFGKPVHWQSLRDSGKPAPMLAEALKRIVYSL